MHTSLDWFGPTCGVLPIGQEAKVTTNGLEWELGPTACEPRILLRNRSTLLGSHTQQPLSE